MTSVFDTCRLENILEYEENPDFQHFLLFFFPMFSKAFSFTVIETEILPGKYLKVLPSWKEK